jgi:hypothetical protein
MNAVKALRASAWTLFLMGVAHLIGHLVGLKDLTSPPDEKTRSLVAAMNGYILPDYQVSRSMMSIYQGFSLMLSATSLMIGSLVIVASSILKDNPQALRRFARIHLGGLFVLSVISVNYLITPPTTFLLVAFGLAAFATARLRKA